ncbi:MAG: hypothetical protein V1867_01340 [Candidatus Falkowbacteria bacterium]
MWFLVFCLIGIFIGYFTMAWLQVVFAVTVLVFLLKKYKQTVKGAIFLSYAIAMFAGMISGNMVYFFPHLMDALSLPAIPDLKNWFIR